MTVSTIDEVVIAPCIDDQAVIAGAAQHLSDVVAADENVVAIAAVHDDDGAHVGLGTNELVVAGAAIHASSTAARYEGIVAFFAVEVCVGSSVRWSQGCSGYPSGSRCHCRRKSC